ncbi:6-phosphofructokinase [Parvibaculum lavamentivorans DS-1]|uniref:6-phosphofructokinase n=1 Tax=Parvibaculum lavamentivorans (strain DS-1 / DSM 13023 / NCIMB 13966) TaxID=402881 RepID=A7HQQ6_PARL1|nr:ATP-dependent 6-phosphofructokinase [Parvibaculum lavamentivorans]ABS62239.1 6-phosphofructokinase [Parvibaculum lavamentivorans DS-1]
MRLGILTGGGDVPGLNPCIKAVVRRATELGWEVLGFRRGWAGPMSYNPDDPEGSEKHLMRLNNDAVRTIDRKGGTILHTTRTDPQWMVEEKLPDFLKGKFKPSEKGTVDTTPHILRVFEHLGIDVMVTIGGDGTLNYAAQLDREGMKIVSIPKTMDNDVFGTDYCIGFSTAVTRSVDAISALRTSTGSHERIAVVELFGRNSGETALISSYLADADRAIIAEVPFNAEKLAALVAADRMENPARYAMVVISEGAMMEGGEAQTYGQADEYGRKRLGGIGHLLGEELTRLTGVDTITQSLAYLMRAGAPDALDQMVAKGFGTLAVQEIAAGRTGFMTAVRDGNYTTVPASTCASGGKRVDVASFYDAEAYRPRIAEVKGKPMFLY